MSNFPWLKERKYQAVVERNKKRKDIPSPVHARGISFTGQGNPNDVAEYTQNGQPVHKGELKFGDPGNDQVITDAMSSRELMSNPVIARKVNGYKCGGYSGRKGYQTGGYVDDDSGDKEPIRPPYPVAGRSVVPERAGSQIESPTAPKSTIPNIVAPNTDAQVKPTIDPEALRKKGIQYIEDVLKGGSAAGRVAGQKQISDLKSTQDVERQVQKQEAAQRGLGESQAAGQMARLTGQQEGQLAEAESQVAIEQLQSQERAAGRLASEGKIQTDIEMAKSVQGLNEAQFGEFIRQFDVGSDQWANAFEERRRQFDVGSDQWNQSFEEQRSQFKVGSDQWSQSFEEQRRQFDVGSEQWDQSFEEERDRYIQNLTEQRRQFDVGSSQWQQNFQNQRRFQWESFGEQKRQFDVGSEQWEKANAQQQDQWKQSFDEQRREFDVGSEQWQKTFDEERTRYDNEDERWWASFNEQRDQFETGTEQWQQSFDQQKHQFETGTDQWNKVHDLQTKEFLQNVDMDKHSVDVWKDNIAYRDKAYADNLGMDKARLEMERDVHEKNMEVLDYKLDATKHDENTKKYWEDSERMFNYASTHLDGFNEETGKFSWDAEQEVFKWFKAKYPGSPADKYATPKDYETADPKFYKSFTQWAKEEWKAATDGRLTNPYDKMLYDVESSDLDDKAKKTISKILTSPESLASIAGIEYDPKTKTVKVKTKTSEEIEAIKKKKKKGPGPVEVGNKGKGPGPVHGPGPEPNIT